MNRARITVAGIALGIGTLGVLGAPWPAEPALPDCPPATVHPGFRCVPQHKATHDVGTAIEASAPATSSSTKPQPALPPAEDQPGWNCRTQGNHLCGTDVSVTFTLPDGTVFVTDVGTAARMIADGLTPGTVYQPNAKEHTP